MNTVDLVVFDMFGTTIQDRGEVPGAFRSALAEHNIALSDDQLTAFRGATKRHVLRRLLGDNQRDLLEPIYGRFSALLRRKFEECVLPVPGAEATFAWLGERGIKIALNTGFDRTTVDVLLSSLRWLPSSFAGVISGDDVANGRPAPDLIHAAMRAAAVATPSRVMNVGDTTLDLQAGAAARVGVNVGVLTGAHAYEKLNAAPHDYLLDSVRNLPDVFEQPPEALLSSI